MRLNEPGSRYLERVNQLDISVAKTFQVGQVAVSPQLDLFNALNAKPVVSQVNTFGRSPSRGPYFAATWRSNRSGKASTMWTAIAATPTGSTRRRGAGTRTAG